MGFRNSWAALQHYFGGPVAFELTTSLFSLPFDFSVDVLTAFSHIYRGNVFEGILTYLIVILSGIVISIGFLWSKHDRQFILSEARRSGFIWVYLLFFPPGLLPVVFTKLRLNYINEVKTLEGEDEQSEEVQEKLQKWKDLNLKANWCEAVLEGKYQSLLQIVILLEPGTAFDNVLDYFPVLTTVKETYSHTMGIYKLADDNFKNVKRKDDPTPVMSRIYGFAYNGVSIFAPALCISGARQWFNNSESSKFVATISAFTAYYILFVIVYLTCLIISHNIHKIKFYITFHLCTLLLYSSCLYYYWLSISQNTCKVLTSNNELEMSTCLRNMYYIVVPIFIFLSILSCTMSYLSCEFAQFALQLLNDRIIKRWLKIKRYGYSMLK